LKEFSTCRHLCTLIDNTKEEQQQKDEKKYRAYATLTAPCRAGRELEMGMGMGMGYANAGEADGAVEREGGSGGAASSASQVGRSDYRQPTVSL